MPENSEKPPDLDNLPLKVAKLIVKPLDYASRNSLRLTTKSLKAAVDESEVTFEKLILKLADHGKAIGVQLMTDKDSYTTLKQKFVSKPSEPLKFIEAAVDRVMKVLKNPNLHLKLLVIDSKSRTATSRIVDLSVPSAVHLQFNKSMEHLLTLLCSKLLDLPFKLSVYHFKMEFDWRQEEVVKLLSILQPVTLKKISLISSFMVIDTDKIVELEQWKRAEELEWICETGMELEHWKHFRRVDIHWERPTKQQMDAVFKHFLFTIDWEHVFITFPEAQEYLEIYFKTFNLAGVSVSADKRDLFDYTRYRSDKESWTIQVSNRKIPLSVDKGMIMMCRGEPKVWNPTKCEKCTQKHQENDFLNLTDNYTGTTYNELTITLPRTRPAILINLIIDNDTCLKLEVAKDPDGYVIKKEGSEVSMAGDSTDYRTFGKGAVELILKMCKDNILIKKLVLIAEKTPRGAVREVEEPEEEVEVVEDVPDIPGWDTDPSAYIWFCEVLADNLAKTQRLLHVEHLKVVEHSYYNDKLLAHLQPGTLKKIEFVGNILLVPWYFENLESWRQAEEFVGSRELPVALWSHFRRVQLDWAPIGMEGNQEMFEALLASNSWEVVNIKYERERVRDMFIEFFHLLPDETPIQHRFLTEKLVKVPGSDNQFINVEIHEDTFTLTRIYL